MSILDAVRFPASWHAAPLGRVVDRIQESGRPDLQPMSVFLDAGVVPRSTREDNHNQLGDDLGKYLIVRPGDLVFNKLRTWQGGFGVSPGEGIVSPAYFVCRPKSDFDPRFIHYLLQSHAYLQELTRVSKWQPPSQFDITWDQLRIVSITAPDRETQVAIADFLDAETTRIDTLINKKLALATLLEQRSDTLLEDALARRGFSFPAYLTTPDLNGLPADWRVARLSQVLNQFTNGYVGPTREMLVDEGVMYVQSLHIKSGRIDFARRPFFVTPEWHQSRPRIHLREGDVLVVQTGDIGQVAVVPKNFGEASCHALLMLRVRRHLISGEFLAAYLRCSFAQGWLLSMATGALHPHLEGSIRAVPILLPPIHVQDEIVEEIAKRANPLNAARDANTKSVSILRERRQALITAAVTGELEIPGAAA